MYFEIYAYRATKRYTIKWRRKAKKMAVTQDPGNNKQTKGSLRRQLSSQPTKQQILGQKE